MIELNALVKGKHSTADWDFLTVADWAPAPAFDLTPYAFVSPPTSMHADTDIVNQECYALCNIAASLDLKEGILISWSRKYRAGLALLYFYIGVTGPGSRGIPIRCQNPIGSWGKGNLQWWQGSDLSGLPATVVIYSILTDGEWVQEYTAYYPPMSGNVNRVGVGSTHQSLGRGGFFDDTEIWRLL